jgi:uncharacterized protein
MLQITQLFIYPIKSMGGVQIATGEVTDRGLKFDRRWMLVDDKCTFITQREYPQMALLKLQIGEGHLRVSNHYSNTQDILVPFESLEKEEFKVTIWNAVCTAVGTGRLIDEWFSEVLKIKCRLMYMPDESMRPVDTTSGYAPKGKFTSFADAYPFLLLGEASVNDLNTRLTTPVSVTRFRPNIVFSGGLPYQEDDIEEFKINGINFTGLENCGRCSIVSINQENAAITKEPLKILSGYRKSNNNVYFGRNLVHSGLGKISVGDELVIGENNL